METNEQTVNRILVVDDTESILSDFRKVLEAPAQNTSLAAAKTSLFGSADAAKPAATYKFELDTASQGQQALKLVEDSLKENRPYCMAFVDMRMPPGWDGLETIRRLWECDGRLQIVLCTAYSDYSLEEISRDLNPGDRLLILKKPFDGVEVLQMAHAMMEKWRLGRQAEMKFEQLDKMVHDRTAEIQHMSLHDKLTGLPNRTLLTERMTACFERQKRHSEYKFAVLFLDFDRFKSVNDSLGHDVGDLLLMGIARRLTDSLRSSDVASGSNGTPVRLGGDEFIVLLDDLRNEADAARVADRLLNILKAPYDINGQVVQLTASIGIATNKLVYDNACDMLRDADTAMYRAKAAGRAQFAMFDPEMHEQAAARLTLEVDLRRAVAESEFVVFYQPIVHPPKGLIGFEALARWQHPTRGLLAPAEFIAVAEEMGVILPMDFFVIGQACKQLKEWEDKYPELNLTMSANISRKHLAIPGLADHIKGISEGSGIRPGSLCLEVTESAVIEDIVVAAKTIESIRQAGIRLYLDDFGTGQSSLSSLHQFPFSGLKIDRSFIQDLTRHKELETVLKAIMDVARTFKMDVIAEGVETSEQEKVLDSLHCGSLQGFLFSEPMSALNAEEYIRNFISTACIEAMVPVHA